MTADYILGHSEAELERLMFQAKMLRPATERLLRLAGIGPGMRVLDVGCGAGDVTMLAAGLVGPSGSVTGIDRSARPLSLAARRAREAGLSWIRFENAALEDFTADSPFDTVIGRYVIMHQADPVAFLRAAGEHVAPGGVLAFHEVSLARPAVAVPEVPLFTQVEDWARRALLAGSPQAGAADRLIGYFADAGLPEPALSCEATVGGGKDSPLYRYIADTTRSALPGMSLIGVSPDELGIDTLEDRLRDAVTRARAQILMYPQFLAVARR